jgi:hypothetical protein
MEISIKQLEKLLDRQKQLCRLHFYQVWQDSGMLAELKKIDKEEKVAHQIHEVSDRILSAEYPNDFEVLKKHECK